MSENRPQLASGSTFGAHTIGALLGRGRDTEVYRAYSNTIRRDVALKIYHPCAITSDEFKHEIATIAALKHPNIMRIYDYGAEGPLYYIVMEMIEGTGLRDLLTLHPTGLERGETLRIFSQIASAVASAHDQHVVHGNLKPDNVLLDRSQRPVLTDFNIPCLRESGDAFRSNTPAYLAPEQASGGRVQPATDIYLLGILLYEMVTGDVPFRIGTYEEIVAQQRDALPRPPSQITVELDPRTERAILRALSKNPADRYPSARDMLSAMESEAESSQYETLSITREQVQKRRSEIQQFEQSRLDFPAPTEETALLRWTRRRRLIIWGTALLLVIAIVVLALLAT